MSRNHLSVQLYVIHACPSLEGVLTATMVTVFIVFVVVIVARLWLALSTLSPLLCGGLLDVWREDVHC
eukprot:1973314-Amphidinium_carterae.1